MHIKDENIESIAHSICDFRDKLEETYHIYMRNFSKFSYIF
jgi:hypothetical protein